MSEQKRIPGHVAIIMDGNGRWATQHGQERYAGHIKGVESVRRVINAADRHGVRYVTLFAFSTENWGRPSAEIDALMGLFCQCVSRETDELVRKGVCVRVIGDRSRLPEEVGDSLARLELLTAEGRHSTLILALNYSSRYEITEAVRHIARRVEAGTLPVGSITEELLSNSLYTAGIPDPDLIIRTSGEQRLSNFLLWQAAYAELYFTPVLWPDFTEEEFDRALEEYAARERRFGRVTNTIEERS